MNGWCVTNISTEPTSFATGSSLINVNRPVWDTCPYTGILSWVCSGVSNKLLPFILP